MGKRNRIVNRTRRNNGEGSIYQRADGRWSGMATVGYDENGKQMRKAVYGKTRLEVVQKLSELTNRIANNNLDYVTNNNVENLMKEWMLVFKKQTVTPRTFEGNFRNFKLHIAPKIGKMKIYEVSTMVVQKLLNEILEQGYSLATTRKVKFLINQFYEYAIENKLTNENPAIKTKVKSTERKIYDSENQYKAIPPEVRDRFITALNSHDLLKPFCLTMMFGGLRVGEVLALRWEDLDMKNKTLKIEYGVTVVPKFDEEGNIKERVTVVSDTKTACSVREIPLPDILINALEEYKKRQWIIGREHNVDLLDKKSLIFPNNDGSVRTYYGMRCIFKRFLKTNNLTGYGIHFHGLRHTYSNMLFENNENPKVVQALLGHKSVKTTISTYNSVDKSYFKKATDLFNREYGTNGERPKEKATEMISNLNDEQVNKLLQLLEKRKQEKEQEEPIQEVKQNEPKFDSYEWEREQRRKRRKEKDFEM